MKQGGFRVMALGEFLILATMHVNILSKKNYACEPTQKLKIYNCFFSPQYLRQRDRNASLVWSGIDGFVRGTWRPPSFVENLLSEKRDQCDRGDLT